MDLRSDMVEVAHGYLQDGGIVPRDEGLSSKDLEKVVVADDRCVIE